MDTQSSFSLSDYPAGMVTAVVRDAERDADRVGQFLSEIGIKATPTKPIFIPAKMLLHLAAALRLFMWEQQGYFFHRAEGLPEACQAICDALTSFKKPNADASQLILAVLRLSIERFAWHGQCDLQADVALDDLTEDAALDALAGYLWASRHEELVTDEDHN